MRVLDELLELVKLLVQLLSTQIQDYLLLLEQVLRQERKLFGNDAQLVQELGIRLYFRFPRVLLVVGAIGYVIKELLKARHQEAVLNIVQGLCVVYAF